MESVQLISLRQEVKPSAQALLDLHVSGCAYMPEIHRHVHANNETGRQKRKEKHNEKRIRGPWSITCLPQSSPRETTPLFQEEGEREWRNKTA